MLGKNQSCRKVSDGCLSLPDCLFCHDSFECQKCSRCDRIFLGNVCKFIAVLWEIFVFVFFPIAAAGMVMLKYN